jgi:hypothetical protein
MAVAAACIVGTTAFAVYTRTLLPGVDLGDTGGFQAAVLWPETSARRGYPLYYFLARPFVEAVTPANPARGLNLFSALTAGLAVGFLAYATSAVTRSVLAGAGAALMLAFSYTFWTQAVIAEVYALHLLLIGACLASLYACASRPTLFRLGVFFAVYSLSFGNHLSMILLLVPFAVFLIQVFPRHGLLRPGVVALAAAIAVAGALQYLPSLVWAWTNVDAPPDTMGRLSTFWVDATKADWRETMVLGVSRSEAWDRLAMWWWDARQQFGAIGLLLAGVGAIRLWGISRPWAVLTWLTYGMSTIFALTYNVGDTHVFFLPAHFMTAFAIGAAVAGPLATTSPARATHALPGLMCVALLAYAGWRAWETYPVADRHLDRRPEALVARIATGVNDGNAVLLSRMNWEPENAVLYSARYERRDLAWTRLPAVLPHLPYLVQDNGAIGRDVVLTTEAAADVLMTFGSAFPIVRDEIPAAPTLDETAGQIPEGVPYVMTLLQPLPEEAFNEDELRSALKILGKASFDGPSARYQVWAGLSGAASTFHQASDRPFRARVSILGDAFSVRMESWLPFDTFRRGGFGHVLRGRDRVLFVERGVSLVWFRPDGSPVTAYAAGLYAPRPRFRIRAAVPQLAHSR